MPEDKGYGRGVFSSIWSDTINRPEFADIRQITPQFMAACVAEIEKFYEGVDIGIGTQAHFSHAQAMGIAKKYQKDLAVGKVIPLPYRRGRDLFDEAIQVARAGFDRLWKIADTFAMVRTQNLEPLPTVAELC